MKKQAYRLPDFETFKHPVTNFELITDYSNEETRVQINFYVKKTWISRIKWKLFCLIFPFKHNWVKEE